MCRFVFLYSFGNSSKSREIIKFVLMMQGSGNSPGVVEAVYSILNGGALNPGDATVLYNAYSLSLAPEKRPSAKLIRNPEFIRLLITTIFNKQTPVNVNHKPKYLFVLACAACLQDGLVEKTEIENNIVEVKSTLATLESVHDICMLKIEVFLNQRSEVAVKTASELVKFAQTPIAAAVIIHWISDVLEDSTYFTSNFKTSSIPIHFIMLDEIASLHPTLHFKLLILLKRIFENEHGLEPLVSVELKKTILQRLLVLCANGFVLEVINYIQTCMSNKKIDRSLIRYFVTHLLQMITGPYSHFFVGALLRLLSNDDVIEAMTLSESKSVVDGFFKGCLSQQNDRLDESMKLPVEQIAYIESIKHRFG